MYNIVKTSLHPGWQLFKGQLLWLTLDAQSGELCAGVVGGELTAAVSDSFWRETCLKWEFGATNCVPETGHRQCHLNDFPEMRKLWKVWSKLPIRPVQAVIPPLRTNCWELIRERDLCFMNLLWWLDPQKAVVYNNLFLSAPDINVLLVTLMITHRQGRSPDTELRLVPSFRDSGHRETEPPLAASVAAAGSRMVGSADGCGEFRSWLTLGSYLTVHWPLSLCLLSALIISLCNDLTLSPCYCPMCTPRNAMVCISRLSASDWAEIVWRQRRGAGGWVPGLTRPTPGVNSGHQHHGRSGGTAGWPRREIPKRIH